MDPIQLFMNMCCRAVQALRFKALQKRRWRI